MPAGDVGPPSPGRPAGLLRVLGPADRAAALDVVAGHPVEDCFVASRIVDSGLLPDRLAGEMWGWEQGGRLRSLCYAGANLVPAQAGPDAIAAYAARAARRGRRCSSIVGEVDAALALWDRLSGVWGPAREERPDQPVLATSAPPLTAADPAVRRCTADDLDVLLPAAVAMFTEEVGVSPLAGGGGPAYRERLAELVRRGHSFARIEEGRVVFKAELAAVSPFACQVQGVWVDPQCRGRGLGAAGMAAVVHLALQVAPVVSLYVNDHNVAARAVYRRVGFTEVGRFATILF